MLKFVIDEDMPRSTGTMLKAHGYDVKGPRKNNFTILSRTVTKE